VGQPTLVDYIRSYGAIVFIHKNMHWPIGEVEGISLAASFETNIILKKVNMKRLGAPYSDCVTSADSFDSDLYRLTLNMTNQYEQSYCLQLCYQQTIIKKCRCSDMQAPGYELKGVCKTINQIDCMHAALVNLTKNGSSTECFKKCNLINFKNDFIPNSLKLIIKLK
jgi:hypothetical protein